LTAPPVAEAAFTVARLGASLTARQTPRDAKATALDASSRTAKRTLFLRGSLERALLPNQRALKECRLFPLPPDLLEILLFEIQELSLEAAEWIFRRVNRSNMRFSF
jgi:hypothetical protein